MSSSGEGGAHHNLAGPEVVAPVRGYAIVIGVYAPDMTLTMGDMPHAASGARYTPSWNQVLAVRSYAAR
jgi:hypothetical protein